MTQTANPVVHAVRFSLDRLDWLTGQMGRTLGLGRLPCLPFLARQQLRHLTQFLGWAEPLMRRLILLMAADLGVLPPRPALPAGPVPGPVPPGRPPARPLFPQPHFRLCEGRAAPERPPAPPPKRFRTGPRIRLLDEETPVDLAEYPAQPQDLLPAGRQVRRLLALGHALDHLPRYVEAMRRLMCGPRPVIARALPRAFCRLPVTQAEHETLALLHRVAAEDCLDTS